MGQEAGRQEAGPGKEGSHDQTTRFSTRQQTGAERMKDEPDVGDESEAVHRTEEADRRDYRKQRTNLGSWPRVRGQG
ncbi:MAG: hypothetical protein K2Y56_25840 [Methylobacterium sp.]|nr:hypothetical protein [Methylobacterium sp.]MBX9934887.1 hypothetical protein [Methylobacterium sp.]